VAPEAQCFGVACSLNRASSVNLSWLGIVALALGGLSAAYIVWFLLRRPKLSFRIKLELCFALLVVPSLSAVVGNVSNLETTKRVSFCGECHVMTSFVRDARDPKSTLLAASHAHVPAFTDEACYGCHADYGMLGGVTTKLGGMRHVIDFYTGDWTRAGRRPPQLYKPYDTRTCLSCHDPFRAGAPLEHQLHAEKIKTHEISCAADGCHGPPHPPWKPEVVK